MLSIEKINFPITFKFYDPYMQVTFTSKTRGEWDDGGITGFRLEYFVKNHNIKNPDNIPGKDGYYEMTENKSVNGFMLGDNVKHFIENAPINAGTIYTASIGITDYRICKIEEMPVGATLKGIQDCNGEWNEITFKPGRVEVHDDVITLLSGYAGWRPKGDKAYGAEINIKRGTNVKFS